MNFCHLIARLDITFDEAMNGVACNLDSRGFHVLCKATEEVVGHVKPYSITGSLPLIRELQVVFIFSFFSWLLLCKRYHAFTVAFVFITVGGGF